MEYTRFINYLGSSLMLRANRLGGSSATVLAAHFAKQNTKFGGGGKARAGKNSFPPTPFLFARPSAKVFQNSASGFSRKKVRISFRVWSQIVCSAFVGSAQSASACALRALRADFKRICHAPRGSKINSHSRKIRFAQVYLRFRECETANLFFSPLRARCKAIIIPTDVGIAQKRYH